MDNFLHLELSVHSTLVGWLARCVQVAGGLVDVLNVLDHTAGGVNVLGKTLENDLDPLLQVVIW